MKIIYRLLISSFVLVIIGLIYFSSLTLEYQKCQNDTSKIAHVDIFFDEKLDDLEKIEFVLCDSIYEFFKLEINDTVCQNLAISNKYFPCKASIRYFFKNNTIKTMLVDSFDCAGCSGSNSYKLKKEFVEYNYNP